ncbi:hypothetical protein EON81_01435 [bacterium]|nr:MAG: hypothetical protein EON81_01435 [bacterium]
MKFFTADRYASLSAEQDDFEIFRRTWEAYIKHLKTLEGVLPDHVLELAKPSGVENGLLVRVRHHRARRVLKLVLRCGDIPTGYYDLLLTYRGAAISPEHDRVLAAVAAGTSSVRHEFDLDSHELDVTEDGEIEHRLLFHPGVWLAIRCRSLEWARGPRPNRRLPRIKNRYPEGP